MLSGELDHRPELGILLGLLEEPERTGGAALLRRWVRASGPRGRPLDQLLARNFIAFEESVAALAEQGFVLRSRP